MGDSPVLRFINNRVSSSVSMSIPPSSQNPMHQLRSVYNTRNRIRSSRAERECHYGGTPHHISPPSSLYTVHTPSSTNSAVTQSSNAFIDSNIHNNGDPTGNIQRRYVSSHSNPSLTSRGPSTGQYSTYTNYRYNNTTNLPAVTNPSSNVEFPHVVPSIFSANRQRIQQQPGQPSNNTNSTHVSPSFPLSSQFATERHWTSSHINYTSNTTASSPSMEVPYSDRTQTHSAYMLRSLRGRNIQPDPNTNDTINTDTEVVNNSNNVGVDQMSENSPQQAMTQNISLSRNNHGRPTTRRRIVTRSQVTNTHNQIQLRNNGGNLNTDNRAANMASTATYSTRTPDNQISNSNFNSSNVTAENTAVNSVSMSHECVGSSSRRGRGNTKSKKMNGPKSAKKKIDYKQLYPRKDSTMDKKHTCPICIEEIVTTELTSVSGCAHKFCFPCIEKWADRENTCPLCKARFNRIDRVNRMPPSKKRKSSSGNTTTTPRVKNTKKIKNRDQRADIGSGDPLQGLFASMEANGHVPQALTQIIFSGAFNRNGFLSFPNAVATNNSTNAGSASVSILNRGSNDLNQFRRASRFTQNRFTRSRANVSATATSTSSASENSRNGPSLRRSHHPGADAFARAFANSDGTLIGAATIPTGSNNQGSVQRNNRQRQLQQQSQNRASAMLQRPLFQVQGSGFQQVQSLFFGSDVSNFHNLEDDSDADQDYGGLVSGLRFEPSMFPDYSTRNVGRSYAVNVHHGGDTADTALEIHDSEDEDNVNSLDDGEIELLE